MSKFLSQKPAQSASKLSSQQYTHLAIKQLTQQLTTYDIDFYTPIQQHLAPMTKSADQISTIINSHIKKNQIVHQIVQIIQLNDPEFQSLKGFIKEQLAEKASNLSDMQSRKNTFMVDCVREVNSYPFKKDRDHMCYNFVPFWKQSLDKQLRRVLWHKSLVNESTKQQYFKWDHEITPYNIELQFWLTLERICESEGIKLKQLQKDMSIKLLEYTVKRGQILPSRSQVYMVLNLVELFSYYGMSRVNEMGAMYVGLEELAGFYFQPRVEQRVDKVLKALELVDQTTFELLNGYFFSNDDRQAAARVEINEIYEHFRLSLGTRYLPLGVAQYLTDQLLIKKKNKFDCYVMFAIVVLVIGDHVEKQLAKAEGIMDQGQSVVDNSQQDLGLSGVNINSLESLLPSKSAVNTRSKGVIKMRKVPDVGVESELTIKSLFESCKTLIKKEDVVEAFNVVYQKIPATYSESYELDQPNVLFSYLLTEERQPQSQQNERKVLDQSESARGLPEQDDEELYLMQQLEQLRKME